MLHTFGEAKKRTGVGRPESELRIAAEKELVDTCHRILAPTEREKNNLVHYYGVDEEKIGVVPLVSIWISSNPNKSRSPAKP
jgi:hypothetical protein